MVKLLLDAKAYPNKTRGNSYLTETISRGAWQKKREIAELLINAKCDVNAVDNEGHSALSLSTTYKQEDIAMLLIANGADVNRVYIFRDSIAWCNEKRNARDRQIIAYYRS